MSKSNVNYSSMSSMSSFVGGHGWMDLADKAYGTSSSQSHGGQFDAIEVLLKEKNEEIAQLGLEND
ncbi:hypothetical protein Leryth_011449 [Lithospermum erythrorhizon]|nr:hypothetical protein Leryth_011449 [Lithospermum erythrorhizon]